MSKQTLHSNYFLAEEDMQDTDLENIDVDELKEHKVISSNIKFFNNLIESFDNFDNKYLTIFFNDQGHILFQVGDCKVLEISGNYLGIIIDSISLNTADFKHLLKTLDEKQIDVFEEEYDGLIQIYLKTDINEVESETILTSFGIALSKIFGSSYIIPNIKDHPVLKHLLVISIHLQVFPYGANIQLKLLHQISYLINLSLIDQDDNNLHF